MHSIVVMRTNVCLKTTSRLNPNSPQPQIPQPTSQVRPSNQTQNSVRPKSAIKPTNSYHDDKPLSAFDKNFPPLRSNSGHKMDSYAFKATSRSSSNADLHHAPSTPPRCVLKRPATPPSGTPPGLRTFALSR